MLCGKKDGFITFNYFGKNIAIMTRRACLFHWNGYTSKIKQMTSQCEKLSKGFFFVMRHHRQSEPDWSQEYECIECMITCYLENKKNKNNNTALILCELTYAHFPGKIHLLALFSFGFDFVTDTHDTSNVINISFGYKQCSQTVYYDYLIYETMTWSCNNENFWAKLSKTQFEQRMHHENYIDKWISCCLRRFFSI